MTQNTSQDIIAIISRVTEQLPDVLIKQLEVTHPADDDNLWWFRLPGFTSDLQIEGGGCPFVIETDEQSSYDALKAETVDEAVTMIVQYLQSVRAGQPLVFDGPYKRRRMPKGTP